MQTISMIETKDLVKFYGQIPALQRVTFKIKQGEMVGLLGPNGSGKTTLLRILATSLYPSSGQAIVAGESIYDNPFEIRKKIGFLPESPPLYDEMTVSQYLNFSGLLRKIPPDQLRESCNTTIKHCGLEEVVDRSVGHLSKGYKQRLGIAQAVVHNPKVLLLDEPTSGLDPLQIIDLRTLLKGLQQKGLTILISSHILSEITKICQRGIIICRGKLVADKNISPTSGEDLEDIFLNAIRSKNE
ncbi:ABC transporter ATP-binding protein [Bdellovibrionota bacterium]